MQNREMLNVSSEQKISSQESTIEKYCANRFNKWKTSTPDYICTILRQTK